MWSAPLLDAADLAILQFLAAHRTDWLTSIPLTIGVLGTSSWVIGPLALVGLVGLGLKRRTWRTGAAVVVSVLAAQLLVGPLKDAIERPRPAMDLTLLAGSGYAFPSTHAAFTSAAVAAYLAITHAARSRTGQNGDRDRHRSATAVVLVGFVAFVGVCMIYLGSHWSTDVLAGWLLGTPLGWLVGRLLRARPPRPGRDTAPGPQAPGPGGPPPAGGGGGVT
ncbi:MAG: phosphatase PAP2 family protein, partial [Micrococcales bacterium]|nr:phosphatase PAP2 family protein [Micrococcales bacterium]